MPENKRFLPLMVDLHGRTVVIFGGGSVGERKAELFSEYANTIVVSRNFSHRLSELHDQDLVTLIRADAGTLSDKEIIELISSSFLVIPATSNRQINDRITSIARSLNILTNQVDIIGEITIPAVIHRGDLVIGISTTGSSPAFSRYVRQKIEKVITPEYEQMIILQNDIRNYLKEHVEEQKHRRSILWKVLEDPMVWEDIAGSYEKAYKRAYDIVQEQINKKD
ncbi:precorrin-2 dehydrogenase/sirohydrochlorin ferrochelatase family protein [Methanomethylovorans sp.]|uniref:precorrin-2 dehydrogenase/sirohydrochlorin ferrochelatase family protein n=1 Tax=Methanomethylovorans sp. TaxID=2758717 RepID=UPI003D09599D